MTRTHEIKLDGYGAHTTLAEDRPVMLLGTAESYGIEMLHVAPGKDWAELTITATFNAADGTSTDVLMGTDGNIAVPTEATAKSGSGRIVFTGVSDGIQRISCDLDYFVVAHSGINGTQSGGVAPSWFEQAVTRFMPTGGIAGQVLTKKSDADFEAEWQDSKGGAGGITPTIGDNGNWYLGSTDTGKPSRGDNGKSAYSYAQDGGYTGTEAEFAAKLAAEKLPNPYPLTFTGAVSETYDGSSAKTIEIPSGGAHSDWNQNDSTAADYIKNRPFYTGDPVETVLVEESTVSFAEFGNGLYMTEFESTFVPTVGEVYKVSWDGTVYECTCVDFNKNPFIGNLSIVGVGSDTGEPFVMGIVDGGISIMTADTSASHIISISGFVAEVVKIADKYLPEYSVLYRGDPTDWSDAKKQQMYDDFISRKLVLYNSSGSRFGVVLSVWYGGTIGLNFIFFENRQLKIFTGNDFLEGVDLSEFGINELIKNYIYTLTSWKIYAADATEVSVGDLLSMYVAFDNTTNKACILTNIKSGIGVSKSTNSTIVTNGDSDVTLSSSTAGSTKKFKITVDDSGTIAATEVV